MEQQKTYCFGDYAHVCFVCGGDFDDTFKCRVIGFVLSQELERGSGFL